MTDVTLLVNSQSSGGNAWFALAQARGYFADEGVNVTLSVGKGGFKAAGLVMEGGVDLAFGDICGVVAAYAEHGAAAPIGIYAVHQNSPAAIVVPVDGPIRSPQDLQGRRLIGHGGDVGLKIFAVYAQAAGIDRAAVRVDVSDLSMLDMALEALEGRADGVFGYYSSLAAAVREGDPALLDRLRVLRFSQVAPDLSGSLVMASRAALATKPEAIRAALRAINRGLLATLADPQAAVAAALALNPGAKANVESARMTDTIVGELQHPDLAKAGFGDFDPRRLERAITLLAGGQGLARPPTPEVFRNDYLPPLSDRAPGAGASGQPARSVAPAGAPES